VVLGIFVDVNIYSVCIYSYNLKTEVKLISCIGERDGLVYPRPGELFARVSLTDQLNEDTDAGKLCCFMEVFNCAGA
jgi:hypothetical protein